MLNVKKTLTKLLTSMFCKTLYDSTKVSSGTIILADAYTNYDFLVISYFINTDRFARVFDCAQISANPTHNFDGDVVSYAGNFSYQSNCSFKPTDSTHLTVANTGNNANFVAGIVKVVGIKIPFIGGGYFLTALFRVFSRLAERRWEYAEYKEDSHETSDAILGTLGIYPETLRGLCEQRKHLVPHRSRIHEQRNRSAFGVKWHDTRIWARLGCLGISDFYPLRHGCDFHKTLQQRNVGCLETELTESISERGWSCA